jgi:hypothetical protein
VVQLRGVRPGLERVLVLVPVLVPGLVPGQVLE